MGLQCRSFQFESSAATAAMAAEAVGCRLSQIVKSLVFACNGGGLVLALIGGEHRVCTGRLAAAAGTGIVKATAFQVKERTGFEIGGVPPLGHPDGLPVFMDRRLMDEDMLWAAMGSAYAVFSIAPQDLAKAAGAMVTDLSS